MFFYFCDKFMLKQKHTFRLVVVFRIVLIRRKIILIQMQTKVVQKNHSFKLESCEMDDVVNF